MAGKHPDLPIESKKAPVDVLLQPFREFARLEASGGLLLLAATAVALIWANSPWAASYHYLFHKTYLTVGFGEYALSKNLIHWINDGLMAVFFLLVGLEIKRELLTGELASVRKAALPIAAALGGMVLPALIYFSFNPSGETSAGWGIPMATDIAFALGILTLVGRGVPTALKVFLVALAIVDDLGAVLVIAVFYTEQLSFAALAVGGAGLILLVVLSRLGVRRLAPFMLIGVVVWVAFLKSGVHATIAGVLLAFTIPHRTWLPVDRIRDAGRELLERYSEARDAGDEDNRHAVLAALHLVGRGAQSSLVYLENALHPFVTYVILPVFALANAGVGLKGMDLGVIGSPVALGILLGLVIGKQAGIFGFSWLAVKFGFADLPEGVSWRSIYGAAALGGIGFTMSLFIASLAFQGGGGWLDVAKLGILLASAISGVFGWWWLRRGLATAPKGTVSG